MFFATFLEKVAQKAAFRDSARPSLHYCTGAANKDRAQGQSVHVINALRPVEALLLISASGTEAH